MNKKHAVFAALALLIIFPFLLYYTLGNKDTADIQISNDFIKKFNLKFSSYGQDSKTFTGEHQGIFIKIKAFGNFNPDQSTDYISDKIFVINSMYRDIDSPYPGPLSNEIKCAEEFKPKTIKNSPFDYYILQASDRLTYGACSRDLIKYSSIMYFLHCGKYNELYQIELFVPPGSNLSEYEESLKSLSC